MEAIFPNPDDLGPVKVVAMREPRLEFQAIVVVDNVAAGPAIGGSRMAPDVSLVECARLARAMTLKNAIAGLPHGGAKSVIFADPAMPAERKERVVRAFARAIADVSDYIVGPDMGTDERCMAWCFDEIGRAVGLPRELGGIPLDEIGATAQGLVAAAEAAQEFCDVRLDGARVAVQGFGAVGRHAARLLVEQGAILVGASDSRGTVVDPKGLDVDALSEAKRRGVSLADAAVGEPGKADAIIDVACDIWIPAARPDVIRADNVDRLDTRLILQGANIPITLEAEATLHRRGVLSVPDFIANAGGVICASVEYHGGNEAQAVRTIHDKVAANTRAVLMRARETQSRPRDAALSLAVERVDQAMSFRRRP